MSQPVEYNHAPYHRPRNRSSIDTGMDVPHAAPRSDEPANPGLHGGVRSLLVGSPAMHGYFMEPSHRLPEAFQRHSAQQQEQPGQQPPTTAGFVTAPLAPVMGEALLESLRQGGFAMPSMSPSSMSVSAAVGEFMAVRPPSVRYSATHTEPAAAPPGLPIQPSSITPLPLAPPTLSPLATSIPIQPPQLPQIMLAMGRTAAVPRSGQGLLSQWLQPDVPQSQGQRTAPSPGGPDSSSSSSGARGEYQPPPPTLSAPAQASVVRISNQASEELNGGLLLGTSSGSTTSAWPSVTVAQGSHTPDLVTLQLTPEPSLAPPGAEGGDQASSDLIDRGGLLTLSGPSGPQHQPSSISWEGEPGAKADLREPLLSPHAKPVGGTAGGAAQGEEGGQGGVLKALVIGFINVTVGLPSLIALAAIVFKAPVYAAYLGALCKFLFLAAGVHQLVFVLLSSQPFAIGQVQDVGLIFLSAMASSVAVIGAELGLTPEVMVATSLITISVSCSITGMLMMVAALLCSYVGYFCLAGGVALGTSTQISSLGSWVELLSWDAALKLVPTAVSCMAMIFTMEHFTHPLALPTVLLSIPLEGSNNFWKLWDMYNLQDGLGGIYWPAVWQQPNIDSDGIVPQFRQGSGAAWLALFRAALQALWHIAGCLGPKLAGLFVVVCFGSCMDMAAIQQEMPLPLDFNSELVTVGLSNALVGLLGAGFTGSYIFSQTIFTMRAGVRNRLAGIVLAAAELTMFALPFSVIQYCPSFLFGALLLWFGVEICRDWLVLSYKKLSGPEYLLLWLTFSAIMAAGLMEGIAAGVVAATLYFAYKYAQSQVSALRVVAASSGTMHSYEEAALLELMAERVATCAISGFIFFGSSTALSDRVKQVASKLLSDVADSQAAAQAALAAHQTTLLGGGTHPPTPCHGVTPPHPFLPSALVPVPSSSSPSLPRPVSAPSMAGLQTRVGTGGNSGGGGEGAAGWKLPASLRWAAHLLAMADAPLFIILDCRQVSHVDATGARTFGALVAELSARGINIMFAGLDPSDQALRSLLSAHGVILRPRPALEAPFYCSDGSVRMSGVAKAGLGGSKGSKANLLTGTGSGGGLGQEGRQQQQEGVKVGVQGEHKVEVRKTQGVEDELHLTPGCCWEFSSLEEAVTHVESCYLDTGVARGLLRPASSCVPLRELVARHAAEVSSVVVARHQQAAGLTLPLSSAAIDAAVAQLEGAMVEQRLSRGQVLFHAGQELDALFLIQRGQLVLDQSSSASSTVASAALPAISTSLRQITSSSMRYTASSGQLNKLGSGPHAAVHASSVAGQQPVSSTAAEENPDAGQLLSRTSQYGPGCLVGANEFYLSRPAAATATCTSPSCILLCLARDKFEALLTTAPAALNLLMWIAMRSTCLELSTALDLMERNLRWT
ncbi:hypothetical protein QJQ45_007217 [Haematococcus lacustris]|nr:hypothetical protein QJQ45_007217 [Haematococcus lacustris]